LTPLLFTIFTIINAVIPVGLSYANFQEIQNQKDYTDSRSAIYNPNTGKAYLEQGGLNNLGWPKTGKVNENGVERMYFEKGYLEGRWRTLFSIAGIPVREWYLEKTNTACDNQRSNDKNYPNKILVGNFHDYENTNFKVFERQDKGYGNRNHLQHMERKLHTLRTTRKRHNTSNRIWRNWGILTEICKWE
jgi:antitoxin component YwqK of YwqJK toxin-antitoxin module